MAADMTTLVSGVGPIVTTLITDVVKPSVAEIMAEPLLTLPVLLMVITFALGMVGHWRHAH